MERHDGIVDTTHDKPNGAPLRLLVVDDDVELCDLMREFFARHGIELDSEHDGRRGLARALDGSHRLIILDVMMPGMDGFELLRQLRRRSAAPVIMLTARTSLQDRLAGLDGGADDYLPKPFGPEELLARVRAILRRTDQAAASQPVALEANGVRLDTTNRQVWRDGVPTEVTSIEFDILEALVRAAGRVVSRDELIGLLHQRDAAPFDRSVDVHVHHLRKKLGDDRTMIKTVRGEGYLFCLE